MLLEFSITNFRSIKDRQTLSMLTSSRVKERYNAPFKLENYPQFRLENPQIEVLKTVALYGKNNSGKTNFFKALNAFRELVISSGNFKAGDKIKANESFEFDTQTREQATIFEIDFIAENKIRYLYKVKFDQTNIQEEQLFFLSEQSNRFLKLFKRENNIFSYGASLNNGSKKIIKALEKRLSPNQLLVSKTAQDNPNEHFKCIYTFFSRKIQILSFDSSSEEKLLALKTMELLKQNKQCLKSVGQLLKAMDTGIIDIELEECDLSSINDNLKGIHDEHKENFLKDIKYTIRTKHRMFEGDKEIESKQFSMNEESFGTRKLFSLCVALIDVFHNGHILVMDELDKALNPYLTRFLIKILYDNSFNKNYTQLIFATHDAALLHESLFAEDQINILEKDYFGKTELTNLAAFKGIPKDMSLEQVYLSGGVGGVPTIRKQYIQFEIGSKHRK